MAPPRKWFPIDKTCPACGVVWRAQSIYEISKQEFCSRKCRTTVYGNGRTVEKTERPCKNCGVTMEVLPCHYKTKNFCSRRCSNSYNNRGERSSQWKGGDAKGKYWKRQAKKRDGYVCQFPGCGKTSRNNHAHHKVSRAIGGQDTLDNLVTLCPVHHREMERQLMARLLAHHPDAVRKESEELWSQQPSPICRQPVLPVVKKLDRSEPCI